MHKLSIAVACVAGLLSVQATSAAVRTPIHFIYTKAGATQAQFQADRDACRHDATKTRWFPWAEGHWTSRDVPSSTVFLNCMAERGYTLARNGWDTGVMWTLPRRPVDWHGPGWHMIEPAGFITAGRFHSKEECEAAKPSDARVLRCAWLDRDPEKR